MKCSSRQHCEREELQQRIEELEAALSDIAKDGCDYLYTCTEVDAPQDEWCPPCKANAALLPGRGK